MLVAEVIVSELARHLKIRTPVLAQIDLPPATAQYEADEEVQDLLKSSIGSNLAVDFLPGAFGYDGSRPPDPNTAAMILWLDAFTHNVDRTWANPKLVAWHRQVWVIDHGAALWFHHSWPRRGADSDRFASLAFDRSDHVLRPVAGDLATAHKRASTLLDVQALCHAVELVPPQWLESAPGLSEASQVQAAYLDHLTRRLAHAPSWWPEAQ